MNLIKYLIVVVALSISTGTVAQQEQKDIFADPQNLKVLPEYISSADLNQTMKSFAMGLGVRCETCHVGEAGEPLATFDFASDDKAMKRKARVMIRMVQDINDNHVNGLNDIEQSQRVAVRCVTCHRGQQQPKLIEDVLNEQLAENGLDATLAKYNELRGEFYGSHSYDFSEYTLPMYAQELAEQKKMLEAIELVKINSDHYPDSYYTFFVLAELYSATGQSGPAVESYKRAIELNPRAGPFLEPMIKKLEEAKS